MFAIIKIGSNQFKVSEGDHIETDRLDQDVNKTVDCDVLMYADGDDVRIGRPLVKDVKVTAKVVGATKGPKVVAFKYRLRKDSSSTRGHRSQLTRLNISKIAAR